MTTPQSVVIVGAGQAGGWAAKTLRAEGFAGRITLVGDEPHPPHERPPLSKAVLAGASEPAVCDLFKAETLAELALDCIPAERATAIDRAARVVLTDRGRRLAYDRLVIATGSRVRRLAVPGADLPGVRYLRTIADALALRERLGAGARLLVVGGGWIGLEAAATARKRGATVTVLEAADRLCARAVPAEVSAFLARLHASHGVAIRLGAKLERFEPAAGGALQAVLADGTRIAADTVLVGVGIVPNVELAREAGLEVANGIVVDDQGRTSDPDVFAAGDVTDLPAARLGRRVRLESWQNAQDQAIVAAKAALGGDARYDPLPWFWSDQYDANIQMLGMPERWPAGIARGDPAGTSFSLFYLRGDRGPDGAAAIEAVVSINAPRELRAARRLIEQGRPVIPQALADPQTSLQKL
ncbi:MAG: FAD-dependent oxidoreductase [Burkholderiales bacterium]|nr:FAD-dependent oxidoreductase [Burkholderiales bacterium]